MEALREYLRDYNLFYEDGWEFEQGRWRGPTNLTPSGYPSLTIASSAIDASYYSKGVLPSLGSSCTDTEFTCFIVEERNGRVYGAGIDIAIDSDGIPWISYAYTTDDDIRYARYVGSGGTGCDGSNTSWSCGNIDASTNAFSEDDTDIVFDHNNTAWVAYRDTTTGYLKVAEYVGSGGTGCTGTTEWRCINVESSVQTFSSAQSLEISPVGQLFITFRNGTDLALATYVGSGGTGCSQTSEWSCEIIDDESTDTVGNYAGIAFKDGVSPYILYEEATNEEIKVANYVGSGGTGCGNGSSVWSCKVILSENIHGYGSMSTDLNGNPIAAVFNNAANSLKYVEYVGTGGTGCDTGITDWSCETVDDPAENVGPSTYIAVDDEGNQWITYREFPSGILKLARYVGGGNGTGCGGNSNWDCTILSSTADEWSSIAFDKSGVAWIAMHDAGANDAVVATNLPSTKISVQKQSSKPGNGDGGGYAYNLANPYSGPVDSLCNAGIPGQYGYCGLLSPEGNMDSITTNINEGAVYGMANRYESNVVLPKAEVQFQTTVSPANENVTLQVYRFGSTNAWETLATYSSAGCSTTNCSLGAQPSGTISEYFESDPDTGEYWVYFRVYQSASSVSGITFSVDSFRAIQTQSFLRDGESFTEQRSNGLLW